MIEEEEKHHEEFGILFYDDSLIFSYLDLNTYIHAINNLI